METDSPKIGQVVTGADAGAGSVQLPLFHAAWLFAVGIAATRALWLRPSLVLVALSLTAVVCGVAAFKAQRIAWLPMAVLWVMLGAWCAWMEPLPAPAAEVAALSDGLLRTVEGTVVDAGAVRGETEQSLDEQASDVQQTSQRIDLRVSSMEAVTDTDDAQQPVEGTVHLTVK